MKGELEEIVMAATCPVGRGSGVGRADMEAENNAGHPPWRYGGLPWTSPPSPHKRLGTFWTRAYRHLAWGPTNSEEGNFLDFHPSPLFKWSCN